MQWQEELYEKFVLNVPRYDGGEFRDVFGRQLPDTDAENPWNAHPIMLASSHLAKRRERQQQLLAADDWDLVVVDEAHHARRKDFQNTDLFRPNRLLELLLGPEHRPGLSAKTRGLLLLTATPMQIDPREVFDLLKLLGMGGAGASRGTSSGISTNCGSRLRMSIGHLSWRCSTITSPPAGSGIEQFCRVAEQRLGPVAWVQGRAAARVIQRRACHSAIGRTAQGSCGIGSAATRHSAARLS